MKGALTLRALILVPLAFMLASQVIVCYFVVMRGSGLETLESDTYALFSERVSSRAGILENDMVLRWSDLSSTASDIRHTIDTTLGKTGQTADDIATSSPLAISIIDATADDLVEFTRRAEVDGVYLILTSGGAEEVDGPCERTALYIRDSNPQVNIANGSDLLISACPIGVTKRLGMALDSSWATTFELSSDVSEASYYHRPVTAAIEYPDASFDDLGYWGPPVNFAGKGSDSITYSLPIRDSSGAVCAVFGVEISTKALAEYFPYHDLDSGDRGSYVLTSLAADGGALPEEGDGVSEGETRDFTILMSTGATVGLYGRDGLLRTCVDGDGRLSVGGDAVAPDPAVVSAIPLDLYNTTSPYAEQRWVLLGLEPQKVLFEASDSLEHALLGALLASFVIGIVLSYTIARFSTSRIGHLMDEVRSVKPDSDIRFTATGVREIDELADSIGALGTDVASAGARLSTVMALSDHAVGAFEYSKKTGAISYTALFFETLGAEDFPGLPSDIDRADIVDLRLGAAGFERLMNAYIPYAEREGRDNIITLPHCGRIVRFVVTDDDATDRVMGLVEDVTREIQIRRRIEHERDHDILTGLLNRRAFERTVSRLLATRPRVFAVMIMIDLDNLKFMNDTYGHDWGDYYIRVAAEAVSGACVNDDVCSRVSGDEFLLFSQSYADEEDVGSLLRDIQIRLDEAIVRAPDGATYKVRASGGAAYYPRDAEDFARLRECADFAMYMAKDIRKGELCVFEKELYEKQSLFRGKGEELNRLLDEVLVEYHFQPIVDARTGDVFAYEALMRPQVTSLATPSVVIDLARMQSKLYKVERMSFFESLRAFSSFDVDETVRLFVNSIGTQRLSEADERELEKRYPDLLSRMVIEITESDHAQELFRYKEDLAERWGASLAIDDFGSGYNGDGTLLDLDARYIKIDIGIVRGVDADVNRQDLIRSLVGYAHDRDLKVIAEGVESEYELDKVIELGVDYIQGFATGKVASAPCDVDPAVRNHIRTISGLRLSSS